MRKTVYFIACSVMCSVILISGISFAEDTAADSDQGAQGVFRFREIVVKDKKDQPGTVSVLG
ncbi:MAG TPA: hypothetical protein PLI62_18430, partial [Spirochaetota bacterium]|nr:hypothetical protein [Spirochaetota bacterium]